MSVILINQYSTGLFVITHEKPKSHENCNIYYVGHSTPIFFRSMLSNRLLSQFSYNTEREIRNLELLKLRFGETSLQQCEVMLKDISDSKRINNAILGEDQPGANVVKLFMDASYKFLQ
jgi:hypothetical protein